MCSINVAAGINALLMNSDSFDNTAVGGGAMTANTTGDHNTAVGDNALANNTTGSSNTALGYRARMSAANQINSTAIGARAEVAGSNNLVLGSVIGVNGATATVNAGIGTTLPLQRLEVVGNVFQDKSSKNHISSI